MMAAPARLVRVKSSIASGDGGELDRAVKGTQATLCQGLSDHQPVGQRNPFVDRSSAAFALHVPKADDAAICHYLPLGVETDRSQCIAADSSPTAWVAWLIAGRKLGSGRCCYVRPATPAVMESLASPAACAIGAVTQFLSISAWSKLPIPTWSQAMQLRSAYAVASTRLRAPTLAHKLAMCRST